MEDHMYYLAMEKAGECERMYCTWKYATGT